MDMTQETRRNLTYSSIRLMAVQTKDYFITGFFYCIIINNNHYYGDGKFDTTSPWQLWNRRSTDRLQCCGSFFLVQ